MSGSDPIEIRTPPVVQVSLSLAVSIDNFFVQNLITNLAFVLNINRSTIRVVKIVAETSGPISGKRSVQETNDTTLTLELGAPPTLVTAVPTSPSVAVQIDQSGGGRSVDVLVSWVVEGVWMYW